MTDWVCHCSTLPLFFPLCLSFSLLFLQKNFCGSSHVFQCVCVCAWPHNAPAHIRVCWLGLTRFDMARQISAAGIWISITTVLPTWRVCLQQMMRLSWVDDYHCTVRRLLPATYHRGFSGFCRSTTYCLKSGERAMKWSWHNSAGLNW